MIKFPFSILFRGVMQEASYLLMLTVLSHLLYVHCTSFELKES